MSGSKSDKALAAAAKHHTAGRLDEAEAAYMDILGNFPDEVAAISNLATIVAQKGQVKKALSLFDRALRLNPAFPDAAINKAQVLKSEKRLEEALECYNQALEHCPTATALYFQKGNLLQAQERYQEALDCYDQALDQEPANPKIQINRGLTLQNLKRFEDALRVYDAVLVHAPKNTEALMNKAVCLTELDQLDEALALCEQILAESPENHSVMNHKGYILNFLGRTEEAKACFDQLVKANPQDPADATSHALILLLCSDFKRGWSAHEARLRKEKPARRAKEFKEKYRIPKWQGEPLEGKSILIDAEQGLGDSIQFIRYARELKAMGARTILASQKPLLALFQRAEGLDELVSRHLELPQTDYYAPMMSLPGNFNHDASSFPSQVPYLHADPALAKHWRDKLAELEGYKIGIFWHGNPAYEWNRQRSIPLKAFRALADIPGVKLISLQKGPGSEQIDALESPFGLLDFGNELDGEAGAFMDSAAIIKTLDLVIVSDGAIAHLAGALAAPLWILLSKPADWRWMLDREDSPWYPTARLFRQSRRGDWDEVMERVVREVKKHVANQ